MPFSFKPSGSAAHHSARARGSRLAGSSTTKQAPVQTTSFLHLTRQRAGASVAVEATQSSYEAVLKQNGLATALEEAPLLSLEPILGEGASDLEEDEDDDDDNVDVQDDLEAMLTVLPEDIREPVASHVNRAQLLEVVLDLGRRPEARFLNSRGGEYLREAVISEEDLRDAEEALGDFGGDNRAGVPETLHRISAIRNRKGKIVGMTCRVGRAVLGHIDMIRDILDVPNSVLFLGRPGVGKTTVIREMARVLADDLRKRVVIVDTSNEIGGDGDVPHPAIGGARRMQVPDPSQQHRVMIEAVENHMPEVVIVDEIGTEAEALACRSIAERGVQLVGTAHGQILENLMKNPTLSDLIGGIQSVTLGDEEARIRQTQKTVLERVASPTFPLVIEMRQRSLWVTHWVENSVDLLLQGRTPRIQVRRRDPVTRQPVVDEGRPYTSMDEPLIPSVSSRPSLVPSSAARTAGRLSPSVDFLRMDEDDFDEEESDAGDDRATSHALAGSGSGSNSSKTGTVLMSVGREMVRVSKEDVVRAEQFNEIGARLRNIAAVQDKHKPKTPAQGSYFEDDFHHSKGYHSKSGSSSGSTKRGSRRNSSRTSK